MGTPLPPNEAGDPCDFCWGPGQPFGDIETPRYIGFQLFNLQPGAFDIPADQPLLLTRQLLVQTGMPCTWFLRVGPYNFEFRYLLNQAAAFVRNFDTAKSVFETSGQTSCRLSYFDNTGLFSFRQSFGGDLKIDFP